MRLLLRTLIIWSHGVPLQEGPQGSTFLGQRWQRVSPTISSFCLLCSLFFLLPSLSLFPLSLPSFFSLPSFLFVLPSSGTIIVRLIGLLGSQTSYALVSSVLSPVTVLPLLSIFFFPFASSMFISLCFTYLCKTPELHFGSRQL